MTKNISINSISSFPLFLIPDSSSAVTPISRAELFAQTFSANSTLDDSGHIPPTYPRSDSTLLFVRILTKDVFYVLSGLNSQEAYLPDGVRPIVLKNCASVLTPFLVKLFRLCLSTSTTPYWKYAYIQPVPKKGDRSNPSSYRSIALLSCLSIAFETILNRKILKPLSTSNLFSDHRYWFRKGRSNGDLLAFLTNSGSFSLSRFGETFVIALDISKAFEGVWHKSFLSKQPSFSFIHLSVLSLLVSFQADLILP